MKTHVLFGGGALLAVLAGCASNPPRELVDARSAYRQAQSAPGANLAQTDLYEAKKALDIAENRFDADGDERSTRDLAYVAQRKALSARARAETYDALEQQKVAQAELQRQREMQAQLTQQQLSQTKTAFGQQAQMLESERQARAAAEERTRQMLSQIEGMKAQEDARGTVLTLSGSVLFTTGKHELLPMAQKRLDQVVAALKQDPRGITIVGHTDSVGSEDSNMELSRQRAESVKRYLVTHGIPDEKVRAEGVGESQPIGDNTSADGRANNRRVEIVLNREDGASGMGSHGGQQGASMGTDTGGGSKAKTSGSMGSTTDDQTPQTATPPNKGKKTTAPKPAGRGQATTPEEK